jgi:hypothetical protein
MCSLRDVDNKAMSVVKKVTDFDYIWLLEFAIKNSATLT